MPSTETGKDVHTLPHQSLSFWEMLACFHIESLVIFFTFFSFKNNSEIIDILSVNGWTLKTFPLAQNLRNLLYVCVRVTQGYTQALYLFVLCCLLTHDRFVAALLVCMFFVGVWLNSPKRDSSSLSGRKEKITSPSILVFDLALIFCLCVSFCLLYSMYPSFYLPSSLQAHHVCDVGRSFVSMLELSSSPLILSGSSKTLLAPHHHPDMWAWDLAHSFVFVSFFSLFIRGIYIHPRLYWPCLTIRSSFMVNLWIPLHVLTQTLSPWGKFYPTWWSPEGCHVVQNKKLQSKFCNNKKIAVSHTIARLWSGVQILWGFQLLLSNRGRSTCLANRAHDKRGRISHCSLIENAAWQDRLRVSKSSHGTNISLEIWKGEEEGYAFIYKVVF